MRDVPDELASTDVADAQDRGRGALDQPAGADASAVGAFFQRRSSAGRLGGTIEPDRSTRHPIGEADRSQDGRGRTALVTGASAGIGQSYASLLAAKGYDVVVIARRVDRLEALAARLEGQFGVRVRPLAADLSDRDAPRRLACEIEQSGLVISYLVNNAGYSQMGPFATTPWEAHERFLQVLAIAPIELTHRLLPAMTHQRFGRVVNVASLAAWSSGTPGMALYSPVKSALVKFTEGLASEVEDFGVRCTASAPGLTDTEMLGASGVEGYVQKNMLLRRFVMSPDRVVREAYVACERGARTIVHGRHHQGWSVLLAHTPAQVRYRLTEFAARIELDSAS